MAIKVSSLIAHAMQAYNWDRITKEQRRLRVPVPLLQALLETVTAPNAQWNLQLAGDMQQYVLFRAFQPPTAEGLARLLLWNGAEYVAELVETLRVRARAEGWEIRPAPPLEATTQQHYLWLRGCVLHYCRGDASRPRPIVSHQDFDGFCYEANVTPLSATNSPVFDAAFLHVAGVACTVQKVTLMDKRDIPRGMGIVIPFALFGMSQMVFLRVSDTAGGVLNKIPKPRYRELRLSLEAVIGSTLARVHRVRARH